MKLRRPAFTLSLAAAVILLGGSAYATKGFTEWPSFLNALFSSETKLDNGDRIVTIKTKDCRSATGPDGTPMGRDDDTYYYRIGKQSPLTNKQVTEIVQGYCDSQNSSAAYDKTLRNLTALGIANKDNFFLSPVPVTVQEASANHLTVKAVRYEGDLENPKKINSVVNYTLVDPKAVVEVNHQRANLTDIAAGDTVTVGVRRADNGPQQNTSDQSLEQLEAKNTVVYVGKNPDYSQAVYDYSRYLGADFVEMVRCDTDPSGYCERATSAASFNGRADDYATKAEATEAMVKSAYDEYAARDNTTVRSELARNAFATFTTDALAAEIRNTTGYDRITCSQSAYRDMHYGSVNNDGTAVIVPVIFSNDDSGADHIVTVRADIATSRITAIICPD